MRKLAEKIVAVLLAIEGVAHWVMPPISFYGMWKEGVWSWSIAATPISDLVFGLICFTGSYFLGLGDKEENKTNSSVS